MIDTANTHAPQDTLLYRVKPNDSLIKIISKYHPDATPHDIHQIMGKVVAENKQITDPNIIYVDQLIRIPVPEMYCPAPVPGNPLITIFSDDEHWLELLEQNWQNSSAQERDTIASLLPSFALGLGSAKLTMLETTFSSNAPLMQEMVENYEAYKSGRKTKGQYDYHRGKLVSKLSSNLGPTNLILNGTAKPREILRISQKKGEHPTQPIQAQMRKMDRVARFTKGGGVVLTGIGLGVACQQIASAASNREKNEILVESTGNVAAGVLYGLGTTAGLLLLATPVGWIGALAIGAGGAVAGYAGGKIARKFYDVSGDDYDFVSKVRVDQICTANPKRPMRRLNSVYSNNVIMGY